MLKALRFRKLLMTSMQIEIYNFKSLLSPDGFTLRYLRFTIFDIGRNAFLTIRLMNNP